MKSSLFWFGVLASVWSCAQSDSRSLRTIPNCEDCELMFDGIPEKISWRASLAEPNEPGEPLSVSGRIFKKDGKTPAAGILLYIYQTDNKGLYSPASTQTKGRRHGHLRGWMVTDAQGRYEFKTIRPASYPNSKNPQHIHPIIKESDSKIYWIEDFLFADDPLLTVQEKSRLSKRGGSGVMTLTKNSDGVWIGKRDIILGLNVP
jgi:protocatechuate 3,4-dioxygenase, beta subunit